MPQRYAYDANNANKSTRRLVQDGMSTEHGYRIICSVSLVRSKTIHSLFYLTVGLMLYSRFILP